jgi:tetratricopeptide (TPR) repeat protein
VNLLRVTHIISLLLLSNIGFTVDLQDEIQKKINNLSEQGNTLADDGEYRQAVEKFIEALNLLPAPIEQWHECTWLLTAIGDVNFLAGAYQQTKDALSDAMHCPGAIGNPFIHMRLGQAQFELGNMERASDELARAYMGAGKEIFKNDDPKYFDYLKQFLNHQ